MKKILSIILAVLMIATTIPFALAVESDGVKTTLDISSKGKIVITDTYVTLNGKNIEPDPDGYIITGRSYYVDTALQIQNNSGNEMTLDIVFKDAYIHAAAYSTALRIDGSSPVVLNVLFEGANTISPYNHPVFVGNSQAVKTINITYSEDSVPVFRRQDKDSETVYNASHFIVNINGELVGYDGHVHENTDAVQTCKGYKCTICKKYFGETGEHDLEAQTCKGYRCSTCKQYFGEPGEHNLEERNCKGQRCTTCREYFGEPGNHIKGEETCLGAQCKTCKIFYGEKYENAHIWLWGYCRYCDEKMPDDAECSHKIQYGGCLYCGYIDENSDTIVFDAYIDGYNFDVFQSRMIAFYTMYGYNKVNELYKSVNEEELKQRRLRGNCFSELLGTVGENKSVIEELMAEDIVFADKFKKCLEGVHNVDEYTSNNDATCMANGTKTGDCTFCSAKNVTVEDEGTMLDSCYTNDGDAYCDGCSTQLICEDCGRPVHEGQINEYICILIAFIKLVVSFFKVVK